MERKVALVTGASRGIGRACAVHLARRGFDIALTARTVDDHDQGKWEHSPTAKRSDTSPIPGTLRETAELVADTGRNTMIVPANLLDRVAVGATVTTVLHEWGRIDVLVNNARFTGPGHMDSLLDTPTECIDKTMEANFFAPVALCRLVLRGMIERGAGWIVNITSRAAYDDPSAPPGKGGWGFIYGASKAALYRVAGSINIEVGDGGIHAVNIDPGLVASERVLLETGAFGISVEHGGPPDAIGAAVAWLVTDPRGPSLATGAVVHAQQLCHEHSLLPGWPGPKPIPRSTSDV